MQGGIESAEQSIYQHFSLDYFTITLLTLYNLRKSVVLLEAL